MKFNDLTADPAEIDAFLDALFEEAGKSTITAHPDPFSKDWNYFEKRNSSTNEFKFWGVAVDKENYYVHFGRIGTKGQIRTKNFLSETYAKEEMRNMIGEKYRKNYKPVKNIMDIQ